MTSNPETAVTAPAEQKLGKYHEDRQRWCQLARTSGLVPKSLNSDAKVFIAIEAGMEAGFSPLQALKSVYVINGMPALTGRGTMALIWKAGVCKVPPTATYAGDGDEYGCTIEFQRNDMPRAVRVTFSVADAKRAKLWGKAGPWTDHPDAMLQWRCVSRMADFYFPDVMAGLGVMEVARDYGRVETTLEREKPTGPDPLLVESGEAVESEPEVEVDPDTGEPIPAYIGPEGDE